MNATTMNKTQLKPTPPVMITHHRIPNCDDCDCVRYVWVGHGEMGCHKVGCGETKAAEEKATMREYEKVIMS